MKAENNEQKRMLERKIDAALSSYPVAPLPSDFAGQVMARIELTPQEGGPATSLVAPADTLRRYLRLYSFELTCSLLLTLGLALGVVWPLFAQAGLLPVLWSGAPAMKIQSETLFAHYFSSWYVVGIGVVILLELGIALLAWMMWMEQPRLKIR